MKRVNFQLSGIVVQGQQNGKKIGFPTANIIIKKPLPIKEGVYLVKVQIPNHEKTYWAMSDYWPNPRTGLTFETYLFDFDEDLYDQNLKIEVLYFLRSNVVIQSLDALKNQLIKDEKQARELIEKIQTGR